jgi:hypothetical protein
MTEINTEKWLKRNVGEGKRFESLEELLSDLKEISRIFGPNCGFAGGPIDFEINLVEEMIKVKKMRKWEFVKYVLTEINKRVQDYNDELDSIIEAAGKIDNFLKIEYPGDTEKWMRDRNLFRNELEDLIRDRMYLQALVYLHIEIIVHGEYCTACISDVKLEDINLNYEACQLCKVGKVHGICSRHGSLYNSIIEAITDIIKKWDVI